MTVTYNTYENDKLEFINKHTKGKYECEIHTSPMVNNVYHKEYCFSDGAVFYERTELVNEYVDAEAHGIKMLFPAQFYKTEYWSTEQPSRYFYEKA